jgi:hypothetical protein
MCGGAAVLVLGGVIEGRVRGRESRLVVARPLIAYREPLGIDLEALDR